MPVGAIDPVCPRAILPMMVTLLLSEMLCVTNIPSINYNNTSFCSELNGKHAGESFMPLRLKVCEITSC